MALSDAALNVMGDALAGVALYAAIHDGPLDTDENSTARQAISWSPASAGDVSLSVGEDFTGPADAPATYVGLWSAATGGTFYGTVQITVGDTVYNAAGEYTLNDLTLSGS